MATDTIVELKALEEVGKRLEIEKPDSLDLSILERFSFTSAKPKKWPSWKDLDLVSGKNGSQKNRAEAIKAVYDLCSTCERIVGGTSERGEIGRYGTMARSIREKLALLEDALSLPDPAPLLAALEDVFQKFGVLDPNSPDVGMLDVFSFRPGKPGLFTVWTDLDLPSGKGGSPNNRSEVLNAIQDLVTKWDQRLGRPAFRRLLRNEEVQKYQAMRAAIGEKLAILKDALLPPNPRPLFSMLEEVHRRFESASKLDLRILDTFAFELGKPGLFTVWTDLDITTKREGRPENRGEVVKALVDLLSNYDRMLERPVCLKMLAVEELQKYGAMRSAVGAKIEQVASSDQPSGSEVSPSLKAPSKGMQQSVLVDAVKRAIGNNDPIVCPTFFSQAFCVHTGAVVGGSMILAKLASLVVAVPFRAIPLVGVIVLLGVLFRRWESMAKKNRRSAAAEKAYREAKSNTDIIDLFPALTRYARAQFLVGLGPEFRDALSQRYASVKNICLMIDTLLSLKPGSLERHSALNNFPQEGQGRAVADVLRNIEQGKIR